MRKIYSLMLIAAGLLIGTQVWAQTNVCELTINGGGPTAYTNIEDAIIAVVNAAVEKNSTLEADSTSATIKLLSHATVAYKEGMNVMGANTKVYASQIKDKTDRIGLDHGERITIDLNGFTLTANMRFYLSHASLYIVGKENSKLISNVPQCIFLMGDNSTMDAPYTYCHAILGENVVVTDNKYYTFCMYYTTGYELGAEPAYGGIKVDIYGQIYSGLPVGTSGNMQVPNQDNAGNKISGINIPIVNIHKTAKLVGSHELTKITSTELGNTITWYDKEGVKHNDLTVRQYIQTMYPTINPEDYENTDAAIYAPGYCELNIQGYVEGGVGIYAKAGYLNLDGAIVKATAARYWPPVPHGNGFYGAGSAIVLDSHAGYGAFPGVTIQNSIITSDAGYAIEEAATSGQTKLPNINVESGVFKGEKGSIETTPEERQKLTEETEGGITGGEWHNSDINAYINETKYQTLVYKDADQKEYKIVVPIEGWESSLADGKAMVKLNDKQSHDITGTMTISDMLFLTNSSKIVVKNGGVLNVGTLIISDGTTTDLSSVTVEPGGKLFVTGNQGVFSRDAECIIIKADATGNGLFLIAPEIIVNTHPLATVEYYAANIGKKTINEETFYLWDRLGSPVNNVLAFAKVPAENGTYIEHLVPDATGGHWEGITWNQMNPFVAYAVSQINAPMATTYSFQGDIVGNASSVVYFPNNNYNYFGNSYVAPVEAKAMLSSISGNSNVDHTIYYWDSSEQKYKTAVLDDVMEGKALNELKPMQAFVLRLFNPITTSVDIDYKNAVWNYAHGTQSGAPARTMAQTNETRMTISILAADGMNDELELREAARFSDAYDNGSEACKIMSERGINFYTTTEESEQAVLATDNILGTALNLQTRNEINYTMSFSNVRGEQYAIQDLETGVITTMEEGATYDFVAPANETIEGRFVVVASRTTPTNLQNAHVGANVMKTMQNGRLMIIKNGRCFDAMGVNVK